LEKKKMFFPNRFQQNPQGDDQDISEFHGPPAEQSTGLLKGTAKDTSEGQKIDSEQDSSFLASSSIINIPRQQRHSAPAQQPSSSYVMPRLLPLSTPPETLRKSFFQIFKPALDELKGNTPSSSANITGAPDDSQKDKIPPPKAESPPKPEIKPTDEQDKNDGNRTPTPVSMLMLKTEF
jgi:hypothetical protein